MAFKIGDRVRVARATGFTERNGQCATIERFTEFGGHPELRFADGQLWSFEADELDPVAKPEPGGECEAWQPKIGEMCEGEGACSGRRYVGAFKRWRNDDEAVLVCNTGSEPCVTRVSLRPVKDSAPASPCPAEEGVSDGVAPAVENTGHLTADPYKTKPLDPEGNPMDADAIAGGTRLADAQAFAQLSAAQRRERARRERTLPREPVVHPWDADDAPYFVGGA